MLNYLLVSSIKPRTIIQNSNPILDVFSLFPIGIAYVSAAMKKAGYSVFTINTNLTDQIVNDYLPEFISKYKIDVICISGMSLDVAEIKRIIALVRRTDPTIRIVVGGAIISADADTAMQVLEADIGVIGEGEVTMCELAHALENDIPLSRIAGLIYWEDGRLIKSLARNEIVDLNEIDYMDFDGFNYSQWLEMNGHVGVIHSARSCPFKCTFCFKSAGKYYRQRSIDSIFKELDFQLNKYSIKSISISDELFAAEHQRILEFCEKIAKYKLPWSCSLRVQNIEEKLLKIMRDSGCNCISTGIESGSPAVLKSMKKGVNVKQIENALEIFSNSDIFMLGNLIFGDVVEDQQSIKDSINLWKRYRDKLFINIGVVCSFPGSHIYNYACEKGIIPDRKKYLEKGEFDINITEMSSDEYLKMYSTITELSYLPMVPAHDIQIQTVSEDGFCYAKWQCYHCQTYNDLIEAHFMQAPICSCSCGRFNTVELLRSVCCDYKILMSEISDEEKVAFWGVGSQYYRISRFYTEFNGDDFIQVDGNAHHQKLTRLGNKIYKPEIVDQRKIRNVIITSPNVKTVILNEIINEHQSVENVYFPILTCLNNEYFPVFKNIFDRKKASSIGKN